MSQDKDKAQPQDPERREFLTTATGVVAGAGIVATSWPFIASMNPSSEVLSKATTEVSLTGLQPGAVKTVEWQGKPVFILHRTDEQATDMDKTEGGKDPQKDTSRVKDPNWLVVVGLCTHLGCVPQRKDQGWFCPCHGSVYDNSGRILKGPAPRNLDLPPYEFIGENKILIGKAKA
ncbi:MAG: ubiquinol-cytochrome c reductase iron-sulfur subunit [Gammaproteobacteria bacterium]|nr:ubiquinol-cytochrome c reductase iron-sulfur subunit [Gammaproteobacteria bacterium]MDH5727932.1 ubiquinol-cytochrome c reductase iron-sulfur subunit [Gammaproteobacteria bacterium]